MSPWEKTLISPDAPIREAIRVIDQSAMQIALVVDDARRLLGVVTDGDIRRGILRNVSLDEPVRAVMNARPTVASLNDPPEAILGTMKARHLHQVPVLDEAGRVVAVETVDQMLRPVRHDNPVVIMAGGEGARLRPLTNHCPKPMLRVGTRPILQTIIESFAAYGFHRFHLAVNYMAEMIEDHFGDGTRWGVEISYLREERALGTAGALTLLPELPTQPLLVMNGDVLTKVNFGHLLDFHLQHRAMATMCIRDFEYQVPYGVVRMDRHRLVGIAEKPVHSWFVSAGIYVLEPAALALIPRDTRFDMPALFETLMARGEEVAAFPLREYWLDIGRPDDLHRAASDYATHFQ